MVKKPDAFAALVKRSKREDVAGKIFYDELVALCKKHHFELSPFNMPKYVAPIMLAFDGIDDRTDYEVGNYGVESVMAHYLGLKINNFIPRLIALYSFLKDHKHNKKDPWEYTDDGEAFYIRDTQKKDDREYMQSGPRKIFVLGRRSRNYLVILIPMKVHFYDKDDKRREEVKTALHIRRLFSPCEAYALETAEEILEEGIAEVLKHTDQLVEITDNVEDYPYVRRPDLAWYQKRNYKPEYGDARDGGYVLTIGGNQPLLESSWQKVDNCLSSYRNIKDVFFWVGILESAIEEYDYEN
jgi:hypothetical protein